jgi:hypothetical protein
MKLLPPMEAQVRRINWKSGLMILCPDYRRNHIIAGTVSQNETNHDALKQLTKEELPAYKPDDGA